MPFRFPRALRERQLIDCGVAGSTRTLQHEFSELADSRRVEHGRSWSAVITGCDCGGARTRGWRLVQAQHGRGSPRMAEAALCLRRLGRDFQKA